MTHSVPNGFSINGPATVTIQPCAIVSLGANATINVNAGASLIAAGTGPGGSISFVRANSAQPWGILRGTSPTSLIDLSWTTLQGGGAFGGGYDNSPIAAVGNGYGNSPNNLVGVLLAQGTAADPIIFTSGEAAPAPGDWVGLWLDTATGSQLDHVVVEYAGAPSGIVSNNCRPVGTPDSAALLVGDFEPQYVPPPNLLTNSTIQFSAGFGIDAIWQAPTRNAPDLTAGNRFQANALCAQTFNALSTGGCGTGLGCTAP